MSCDVCCLLHACCHTKNITVDRHVQTDSAQQGAKDKVLVSSLCLTATVVYSLLLLLGLDLLWAMEWPHLLSISPPIIHTFHMYSVLMFVFLFLLPMIVLLSVWESLRNNIFLLVVDIRNEHPLLNQSISLNHMCRHSHSYTTTSGEKCVHASTHVHTLLYFGWQWYSMGAIN